MIAPETHSGSGRLSAGHGKAPHGTYKRPRVMLAAAERAELSSPSGPLGAVTVGRKSGDLATSY